MINERARKLGITVVDKPAVADPDTTEGKRITWAREHGLPDNTSWKDIAKCEANNVRKREAKRLGLSENAGWLEIRHGIKPDPKE